MFYLPDYRLLLYQLMDTIVSQIPQQKFARYVPWRVARKQDITPTTVRRIAGMIILAATATVPAAWSQSVP